MKARALVVVAVVVVFSACKSEPETPPGIYAVTVNLGEGGELGGSGTMVLVVDPETGVPMTHAAVSLNGVTLAYDPSSESYGGAVAPARGETVTLSVSVGGRTFTAVGSQLATFPTITAPTPSAPWSAACSNTITWTAGAPETGGTYQVLVLEPDGSPRVDVQVGAPVHSFTVLAGTCTAGEWGVAVALMQPEIPIGGAAGGSALVIVGGGVAPVTVSPSHYRSVRIFPEGPGLAPGGTRNLRAFADDCAPFGSGLWEEVTERATWTTANSAVAAVSDAIGTRGLLTGVADGQTTVSAEFEGIRGGSPTEVRTFARHALPPDDGALVAVTWTGSLLVAVGSSGRVATSPDGVNWTARESGTQVNLESVAASPQAIVAAGFYPSVFRSVDGITWTEVPVLVDVRISAVVWAGSQFVAVGTAGTIVTSPDGLTWTPRSSGTAANLRGVAWSGTRLVAAGWTGGDLRFAGMTTSTDGVSWTPQAVTSGVNSFEDVAFGPGGFVAVRSGDAISSPDGLAWVSLPALQDAISIAGAPEGFVATPVLGKLITSVDGRTWFTYEDPEVVGGGVAFLQGRAVIVGSGSTVLTTSWP